MHADGDNKLVNENTQNRSYSHMWRRPKALYFSVKTLKLQQESLQMSAHVQYG